MHEFKPILGFPDKPAGSFLKTIKSSVGFGSKNKQIMGISQLQYTKGTAKRLSEISTWRKCILYFRQRLTQDRKDSLSLEGGNTREY